MATLVPARGETVEPAVLLSAEVMGWVHGPVQVCRGCGFQAAGREQNEGPLGPHRSPQESSSSRGHHGLDVRPRTPAVTICPAPTAHGVTSNVACKFRVHLRHSESRCRDGDGRVIRHNHGAGRRRSGQPVARRVQLAQDPRRQAHRLRQCRLQIAPFPLALLLARERCQRSILDGPRQDFLHVRNSGWSSQVPRLSPGRTLFRSCEDSRHSKAQGERRWGRLGLFVTTRVRAGQGGASLADTCPWLP